MWRKGYFVKDNYLTHSTGGQVHSVAYVSARNFPSQTEVVSSSSKVLQETYFWSVLYYHRSRGTQVATKAGGNLTSVAKFPRTSRKRLGKDKSSTVQCERCCRSVGFPGFIVGRNLLEEYHSDRSLPSSVQAGEHIK